VSNTPASSKKEAKLAAADALVDQAAALTGGALAGHIDRCIKAPNVFAYGEFLDLPNVIAVRRRGDAA
jgi:hypothetical protein